MSFAWLSWSNPVAIWWFFLIGVSAVNVLLWFQLRAFLSPLGVADPDRHAGRRTARCC